MIRTQTKSYSLVTQKEHQRPRCQTKPIRKETLVKCKNTLISCCTGETVKHSTIHRTSITSIHKTSLGKIHGCTRNGCDLCCVCILDSLEQGGWFSNTTTTYQTSIQSTHGMCCDFVLVPVVIGTQYVFRCIVPVCVRLYLSDMIKILEHHARTSRTSQAHKHSQ